MHRGQREQRPSLMGCEQLKVVMTLNSMEKVLEQYVRKGSKGGKQAHNLKDLECLLRVL